MGESVVNSTRLLGGLLAAAILLDYAPVLAQRVQFPSVLPANASLPADITPVAQATVTAQRNVAPPVIEWDGSPEPYVEDVPIVLPPDAYFPGTATVMPGFPEDFCPKYKWRLFGDFVWLKARTAEVAYAIPFDWPLAAPPIQLGSTGIVDPGFDPGIRVGISRELHPLAHLVVTYARLESSATDAIAITAPDVIRSLVVHPGTTAADWNFNDAMAAYGIDFDHFDADYRGTLGCDEQYVLNYTIGGRWARLREDFHSRLSSGVRIEEIDSRIKFDGGGIRIGLEGERRSRSCGLLVYARGAASLIAGKFHATYQQDDSIDGTVVNMSWAADRVVPILEAELGLGWTSPRGYLRLTAGYMFTAWYNTVKTDEFIQAVQSAGFIGLGNALTFDGLVARVELRF